MIVSLQLRHYKIYKNINFVPISNGDKFSVYIGNNGIGKTSVLCALDKFFNSDTSTTWNINASAKKDGLGENNKPYIVPTFILHKSEVIGKNNIEVAKELDTYFRNTNYKISLAKEGSKFYSQRKELLEKFGDDYFFISIGKKYQSKDAYFGMFDSDHSLKNIVASKKDAVNSFLAYIISSYNYIYLPVEISLSDFTKLEKKSMGSLMDQSIEEAVNELISAIDIGKLNGKLDSFLETLEKDLKQFKYEKIGKRKNFNKNDLIEKIIEVYFSTKILYKKNGSHKIPIESLSSGEKRKALIEILLSFLKVEKKRGKNVIIAIDEPEASLHISNCYNQFRKIFELSEKGNQVILTSHWYGFLPVLSKGYAINIKKNETSFAFNLIELTKYREQIEKEKKEKKGKVPYDINIKSYNDLIQSIAFSLQKESSYNWIVCEGSSERIYFEYYFKNEISTKNLRLLPAGGFDVVKKIYEYLKLPIKELEKETDEIFGKVYCLIDTDEQSLNYSPDNSIKKMKFKRLLNFNLNEDVRLENIDSNNVSPPTEIEDCLDPNIFYETLKYFSSTDSNIKKILDDNELIKESKNSKYIFDLKRTEEEKIKNFFNENNGKMKIEFAEKYVEIIESSKVKSSLVWIEEMKNFFNSK